MLSGGPTPLFSALLVAGVFVVLLALESWRPLRKPVSSRLRRAARNFTTGGISLALLNLLQAPILVPFARWAGIHRVGLVNLLGLAPVAGIALTVVLLDYTLWIWHRWNHLVPFLWRFHLVHHVDRDMDASTAFRFHFGEQILSIGCRLLQVLLIGAGPTSIWIWHGLLVVAIVFHHSNTRLPIGLERLLVKVVVTPRMHGIHHSHYRNEANGNWASLFSAWDYLHGTVLLNVPQETVAIGVPAYQNERDVRLGRILAMPFVRQRQDWVGEDGPRLERPHDLVNKSNLAP
jgi:sterol desaturase/sphingolipid hydroxylase (fatty acid hydroxylase superfamily)